MKQVTLKKNVSGIELVTANWLASEDFVNCPDIFIIENIFLRKKIDSFPLQSILWYFLM